MGDPPPRPLSRPSPSSAPGHVLVIREARRRQLDRATSSAVKHTKRPRRAEEEEYRTRASTTNPGRRPGRDVPGPFAASLPRQRTHTRLYRALEARQALRLAAPPPRVAG